MRALSPNAGLLLLPLFGLALACSSQKSDQARPRPPPLVTTQKAEARDVPVEVHAPVDLRPLLQADVGAKTLGYLDAVLVDRGDKVRKGQLVAIVRPSDLPDQLSAARGQLAQTEASLQLAKVNFERAQLLAPKGVVSQQEYQQASAALASAQAAQAAAQANLGVMATRLGEARLEAPLDGLVLQRRLDPGALVGPTNPVSILTVGRTDVLRMFVAMNERDAPAVAVGQEAHVQVDALPGRTFTGRVVRMTPAFDPTTRTLEAEVHLPNPDGLLRPGMYGRASILVATHPHSVVVPVESVLVSAGKRYVFTVTPDSKVHRRAVQIGVDGGEWLEVLEGLAPGDDVVTAGTEGLSEGASVRTAKGVDPYSGQGPTADNSRPSPAQP